MLSIHRVVEIKATRFYKESNNLTLTFLDRDGEKVELVVFLDVQDHDYKKVYPFAAALNEALQNLPKAKDFASNYNTPAEDSRPDEF